MLVAPDGLHALDIVARITPNAVLMDAVMPDLGRFETVKWLQDMEGLRNVPIIFMTGLSDTENVVRGLEAGRVDSVTKPVNTDELLARLRVHIANARSAESAHVALDASGRFLLSASVSGRVRWRTPQAAALLGLDRLPDECLPWLREVVAGAGSVRGSEVEDFFVERDGVSLRFYYVGAISSSEHLLCIAQGARDAAGDTLRSEFNLTEREAEVLVWIMSGKSNKEIASILEMSPRTVNKHLDRIFAKFGVENRTAAAILSLKRLID
ncbi:LuxR C-terminal-related transcriptional regulator [Breoghania sp.]|uniref:LuxR C-terminal-related transcriptional regulator n=1 Tax=Breoghania sp. TaxID=2065378 RepID=UPI003204A9B9